MSRVAATKHSNVKNLYDITGTTVLSVPFVFKWRAAFHVGLGVSPEPVELADVANLLHRAFVERKNRSPLPGLVWKIHVGPG
jgi:hypothetical protein